MSSRPDSEDGQARQTRRNARVGRRGPDDGCLHYYGFDRSTPETGNGKAEPLVSGLRGVVDGGLGVGGGGQAVPGDVENMSQVAT